MGGLRLSRGSQWMPGASFSKCLPSLDPGFLISLMGPRISAECYRKDRRKLGGQHLTGGKNPMSSWLKDLSMWSLCFRNPSLARNVDFTPWGMGQKEPGKPKLPGLLSPSLPSPTPALGLGVKGRGLGDHHSDSGMQTLSSFRVLREAPGGSRRTSQAVNC